LFIFYRIIRLYRLRKKLTTYYVLSRVIALLRTYKYEQEAARIFISVSKTDARTLFDNNILSKKDPRVRKTPFMTARPTLNETKRTIAKLLAVTTTGIEIVEKKKKEVKRTRKTTTESKSKVDLEMQKQLEYKQEQAAKAKKIVETPEPELHKASRTGDVDALTQMLESACLNPQTGDGAVVDPSLPWRGKTAYLVAKDGETRDAFRRVYFKYPDAFDWESRCDVPSMLTPEMELKREEKEKDFEETKKKKEAERKKALKTKKKASASALLAAEEENMKSATGNKKSPSSVATSAKDLLASEKNAADERRTTMVRRLFLSPIIFAQNILSYRLRRRRDAQQQRKRPATSNRHQRKASSKAIVAERSEEERAFKEVAFKLGFAAFALVALSKSVREGAKKKREWK